MKIEKRIVVILAAVFVPVLWFIAFCFAMMASTDAICQRSDFTAAQQAEITEALGFDIAPGETLTVSFYAGFWPNTIAYMWGEITGTPSEQDFLSRCHEETAFSWAEHSCRPVFSLMSENAPDIYGWGWEDQEDYELAMMKKVQGMINNLWEQYVNHFFIWGWLAAEVGLIVALVVNRRKAKKKRALAAHNL